MAAAARTTRRLGRGSRSALGWVLRWEAGQAVAGLVGIDAERVIGLLGVPGIRRSDLWLHVGLDDIALVLELLGDGLDEPIVTAVLGHSSPAPD